MDFSGKDSKNKSPSEYQKIKIKHLERQFEFSFEPWLFDFAMTVSEPVKVHAWLMASKHYSVAWDPQMKEMDFSGKGDWGKWGLERTLAYLGKEIYDHFGRVNFTINGKPVENGFVKVSMERKQEVRKRLIEAGIYAEDTPF